MTTNTVKTTAACSIRECLALYLAIVVEQSRSLRIQASHMYLVNLLWNNKKQSPLVICHLLRIFRDVLKSLITLVAPSESGLASMVVASYPYQVSRNN